ncbi:MAG: glutathione S-transferase family protein [Candidatus Binatia bacterium]
MKLYHAARSRSTRPRWMLEEIGAPYDLVRLDMQKGEHKAPEYLKVHAHGQVPALIDGDLVLMESAAICAHLADRFPDAKLAPALGTPERGRYYQWLIYSIATLEPPVLQVFLNTVQLPEADRSAVAAEAGRTKFADVAQVIASGLGRGPFLLGAQFTAADVMIGSTLAWASLIGLLKSDGALGDYVARLSARPAFQRAWAD